MYTNKWDSPGRYGYTDQKKEDGLRLKKIINVFLNIIIMIFALVIFLCVVYLLSYGMDISIIAIIVSSIAIISNAFVCKYFNRLSWKKPRGL